MTETELSKEESEILKTVLGKLTIKKRTGKIGILHGMDRFVSTHLCLNKKEIEWLASAVAKIGLKSGIKEIEKHS
jgi:hypothetical protein